jgi:holliday junction DNA helicase RuvA
MIMRLQGTVIDRGPEWVLVDIGGVGYRVGISSAHVADLPVGDETVLWTHEAIRDDKHELYGVRSKGDLELFWKLIGVNGVGPKAALKILGMFDAKTIRTRVMDGDADFLTAVSGIGMKKAQKIVLELRGSIDFDDDTTVDPHGAGALVEALVSLGYQKNEARSMADAVPNGLESIEEQLKAALQTSR